MTTVIAVFCQPEPSRGKLLVYWLLFAGFALPALVGIGHNRSTRSPLAIAFAGSILALIIGLRFEVGGDWGAYERMFQMAHRAPLDQIIARGDPAYQFVNWCVERIGADIWLVNLICSAIFTWGLVRFAWTQASPWTVMIVAIPYLVIVVAMGYTRQGVAIGILMGGLASLLRNGSVLKFSLYVFVAALFHKTAIVGLLLVLVSTRRNLLSNIILVLGVLLLLYDALIAESLDSLMRNYVDARYASEGAAVRVAMSAIPGVFFLVWRRRFGFSPIEDAIWRNFTYAVFFLVFLLAILPSSTVVDRLALYLLPLQLAIIARLPGYVFKGDSARFLIIFYAFAIQWVWLNFANHASYWLPFQFYPIGGG